MKFRIPKAFLIYVVALFLSCVLVIYKTNEQNNVVVAAEAVSPSVDEISLEDPQEDEQNTADPGPLTVDKALSLLYEHFNLAEKQAGRLVCLNEDSFRLNLLGDLLIDENAVIRRNEFAYLCLGMNRLLGRVGMDSDGTYTHINEIYYIPDVCEVSGLPYREEILEMYRLGIVGGNDYYGNYEPFEAVSLENANIMASRILYPEERIVTSIPGNTARAAIPFKAVLQNPELPSGCEITSLTMVLNYLGYDVDKCDLADNYLDKGEPGEVSYYDAFIGDPRKWWPYGCFSPVIERTAVKYLTEKGSTLGVYNTTGTSLDGLFTQIEQGNPVIIWATMYMSKSYEGVVWIIDGVRVPWISGEHCMVLYGYDRYRNVVLIADPLVGNVEYDMDLFKIRFEELFRQSVVIR